MNKGQLVLKPHDEIILELEQDNLVLSIVSKLHKSPFEITWIRDSSLQINTKFHEQRAITTEGILNSRLC